MIVKQFDMYIDLFKNKTFLKISKSVFFPPFNRATRLCAHVLLRAEACVCASVYLFKAASPWS